MDGDDDEDLASRLERLQRLADREAAEIEAQKVEDKRRLLELERQLAQVRWQKRRNSQEARSRLRCGLRGAGARGLVASVVRRHIAAAVRPSNDAPCMEVLVD